MQRIDAGQANGEEDRIEAAAQFRQFHVVTQHLAGMYLDAADGEDELDLALGKVVRQLIGGNAVFVEPAQLVPRLEKNRLMAEERQAMGAGQAGRPAADDQNVDL